MKQIIVVLALVAACSAGAGLRVRFGINPFGNFFMHIPRTISDAIKEGWTQTVRPAGPMESLTLYCPADRVLCALFDDTLNVAGLQVALPEGQFSDSIYNWTTQGFTQWNPPSIAGEAPRTFWTLQQYFVDEDYLAKTLEERLASWNDDKVLQLDAVWVTGFNGVLERISNQKSDIEASDFTEQACIPLMGRHYYYKMDANTECAADTLFPWFSLTNSGQLVATGFVVFGQMNTPSGSTDWFEHPTQDNVKLIVPDGPECLYQLAGSPGLTTMHIYYVDNPYLLHCIFQ